ncbi:chorismate--pyruvate lyase family protein [Novosphingobium jiangmenense]|uniref:Lipoprotein n=1 Tax=Novosphingobium jiangmenense TaxID=2791981 RepID=A0ABS0HK88_9SPHN|nr:hypothetical protein [Novosphingobium jiangmenense]MBF9152663.1 hypothetical protein [Novosphingobium jiangmenense]
MRRLRPEAVALATFATLALTGCGIGGIKDFEKTLASNDSATAALGQWCAKRALAAPPVIRALADRSALIPASPAIRKRLGVSAEEPIAYRHVQLACGDQILSVAHNWYVPSRLTTEMNRTLTTSDKPFGKVVAPLAFRRDRLAQKQGAMPQCPADTILSHEAVLRTPDGKAISLVIECYTPGNL